MSWIDTKYGDHGTGEYSVSCMGLKQRDFSCGKVAE